MQFTSNYKVLSKHIPDSKHIVLILGWGGAKQRNFRKLLRFYNDKNVSTVLHIMPLWGLSKTRRNYAMDISRAVKTLQDRSSLPLSFHVHLFSNNGSWAYATLLSETTLPNPDSIVIDSAPYFTDLENLTLYERASGFSSVILSIMLQKNVYHHPVLSPLVTCLCYIVFSCGQILMKLQGKNKFIPSPDAMSKYLRENIPVVPTLFLYSLGDKLIPPTEVRKFQAQLKDRGVPVDEEVFGEDVNHVASMFKCPELYYQRISNHFFGRLK